MGALSAPLPAIFGHFRGDVKPVCQAGGSDGPRDTIRMRSERKPSEQSSV
jgi:hypothetical protein